VLRAAAAAALGTAGGVIGGCDGTQRRLQVAVVWSDREWSLFRRVLDAYQRPVDVLSAGDNIDAFLRARKRTGAPPDVAVVSRPGLVAEYAGRGWLFPLDEGLADRFDPAWSELLRYQDELFGVWVKAAHKSLMWRLPTVLDEPPQTWPELTNTVRELGADSARTGLAPLAIGAADGWVLTDWFENVLAAISEPPFSQALTRGEASWTDEPVQEALERLGELWSLPGAFPGGAGRALLTQFAESVIQVATGRAAMVFEGDFVASVAASYRTAAGEQLTSFPFPAVRGERPLVVGGDAAVLLRGSTQGHDLVEWLTRAEAFVPWIENGGYLSPLRDAPIQHYPDSQARLLARELAEADGLQFDLSDRLPGLFTGADGVGSWRILQEFFADVTTGAGGSAAVDLAMRRLSRAARQAASEDGGGL
jgi:ABC-type glycerol-3-phosphate transport system substrate-binding protein